MTGHPRAAASFGGHLGPCVRSLQPATFGPFLVSLKASSPLFHQPLRPLQATQVSPNPSDPVPDPVPAPCKSFVSLGSVLNKQPNEMSLLLTANRREFDVFPVNSSVPSFRRRHVFHAYVSRRFLIFMLMAAWGDGRGSDDISSVEILGRLSPSVQK